MGNAAASRRTERGEEFDVERLFMAKVTAAPAWVGVKKAPTPNDIHFASGSPDPATYPVAILSDLLARALRDDPVGCLDYVYEAGYVGLREGIVGLMTERDGVDLDPDQILLTNGSCGVFDLVASLFTDPGDVVISERLTFNGGLKPFRLRGATIVAAPMDEEGLLVDEVEDMVRDLVARGERVKVIVVTANCQNPVGSILPLERRRRLAEIAEQFDIILTQDDTYGDFRFANRDLVPLLALSPDHTVHAGSFSKCVAPGLRVGWAATSPAIASMMKRVRSDLGTPPLLQRAMALFVQGGHFTAHVAEHSGFYLQKRDALFQAIDKHCSPYCTWSVPPGGYFVLLTLKHGDVIRLGELAAEDGVWVSPGPFMSAAEPDLSVFRLSCGELPIPMIQEGVRRLGGALERHAREIEGAR
jgi:DNA-binding transcriptional MocR family regulator